MAKFAFWHPHTGTTHTNKSILPHEYTHTTHTHTHEYVNAYKTHIAE